MKAIDEVLAKNNIHYLKDVEMKRYTTMGIGGIAPYLVYPKSIEEIKNLKEYMINEGIKFKVIGGGSNIIISDGELKCIFLSLKNLNVIERSGNNNLRAGAGVKINHLCNYALKESLSGLEFLIGIPGTVGGALKQNAGAWGKEIKDVIIQVTIIDSNNKVKKLKRDVLDFHYRGANLNEDDLIVEVEMGLINEDSIRIKEQMEYYKQERMAKQPLKEKSAGCIFKNPKGGYAGKLIEEAGLKGFRCGGAVVSEKHANFIVNRYNANYKDVIELIEKVRSRVEESSGTSLELEVEVWDV